MSKTSKFIVVFLLTLLGFVFSASKAYAVGVTPEDGNIWHTVSNGSTSNSGSNLLFSPKVNLKVVSNKNGGFQISLLGGGQCNDGTGYDSGSSGPKVTQYRVRATDANGNLIFGNPIVQVDNGGGCSQKNITLNIPAGKSQKLTTKGFEGKYAFYVAAEILNASPTADGYLNIFKAVVVPNDGDTDIGPAQSEQGDRPVAFLGRPNDSLHAYDKHNYYLKFGTNCDLAQNSKIKLAWFDADAKTTYQDDTIYFQLVDKTNGGNVILKTNKINGISKVKTQVTWEDLGGEASRGDAEYTFQPGHQYEWQWRNVTNSNGVQVNYPFDAVNYVTDCPTPSAVDQGRCEPNNENAIVIDPKTVSPGQKNVRFTVKIKNTGDVTWNASDHFIYVQPGWSDIKATDYLGNNLVSGPSGHNIKLSYGTYPPSGGPILFTFTATAPADPNQLGGFGIFIVAGDPSKEPTGTPLGGCSRNLDLSNKPFIRVSGGDTTAGSTFSYEEEKDNVQQSISEAQNAQINTNGSNEENLNAFGSSSSEYAVIASGEINAIASLPNAFYSNNYNMRESARDIAFANTDTDDGSLGKYYDGGVVGSSVNIDQYVSDAKSKKIESSFNGNNFESYFSSDKGSVYFDADGGRGKAKTSFGGELSVKGTKIIVVKDDIRINRNITYDYGNGSIPNLVLIALGDIYIDQEVDHIDGTYIAFPLKDTGNSTDQKGIFDTCTGENGVLDHKTGIWPANLYTGVCDKQLTVNGRVIARKVFWKRTYGTLGPEGSAANKTCVYKPGEPSKPVEYSKCSSEHINMSPLDFFGSQDDSTSNNQVGNVPISSIELPPIY